MHSSLHTYRCTSAGANELKQYDHTDSQGPGFSNADQKILALRKKGNLAASDINMLRDKAKCVFLFEIQLKYEIERLSLSVGVLWPA